MSAFRFSGLDSLPKFNGSSENYSDWRGLIIDLATVNGVGCLIDGSTSKDGRFSAPEWDVIDHQLHSLIRMSLSPDVRRGLPDEPNSSSIDFLKKLDKRYATVNTSTKFKLLKDLIYFKQNGRSVSDMATSFQAIVSRIKSLNIMIDDLISLIFLNSFDPQFEVVVQVIGSQADLPSLDDLISRMLSKEADILVKDESSGALVATETGLRKFPSKRHEHKRCSNCGKSGHTLRECFHDGGGSSSRRPRWWREEWNRPAPKKSLYTTLTTEAEDPESALAELDALEDMVDLQFLTAYCNSGMRNQNSWIVDSGCSTSASFERENFINYRSFDGQISIGDGSKLNIVGIGTIKLWCKVGSRAKPLYIDNAHHVPQLTRNLLSVGQLKQQGLMIKDRIGYRGLDFFDRTNQLRLASRALPNNLFEAITCPKQENFLTENEKHHYRFGHMGNPPGEFCDICDVTKATTRRPPKICGLLPSRVNEIVVSDIWGPYPVASLGGSRYMLSFTDAKSRYSTIYFMKTKAEVTSKLILHNNRLINEFGRGIQILRSDNGAEYKCKNLIDYTTRVGIIQQFTVPYQPAQNGIAERLNRTIVQIGRALKLASGVPDFLWPEILQHANTIHNVNICTTTGKTPHEIYFGEKPETSNLRIFGSIVATHREPSTRKSKLDPTGVLGVYVGNSLNAKGFRIWLPNDRKIVDRVKVKINEERFYKDVLWTSSDGVGCTDDLQKILPEDDAQWIDSALPELSSDSTISEKTLSDASEQIEDHTPSPNDSGHGQPITKTAVEPSREEIPHEEIETIEPYDLDKYQYRPTPAGTDFQPILRPRISAVARQREQKLLKEKRNTSYIAAGAELYGELGITKLNLDTKIPSDYWEAAGDRKWKDAIAAEAHSFKTNHVFTVVERKEGIKCLPGKWIFTRKSTADGGIRHKARFVAMGFRQREGLDYEHTYAPTTINTTLKILFSIIAKDDLNCIQMDVTTAFLNGVLQEEIYMEIPDGFDIPKNESQVVRLNKAVYGLKQAGYEWNSLLDSTLKKLHLTPLTNDRTVYVWKRENTPLYLIAYVDDIIVASKSSEMLEIVKNGLQNSFTARDMGELRTFLGIEIKRNRLRKEIYLSQTGYLMELNKRFMPETCRQPNNQPDRMLESKPDQSRKEYQRLVGALLWVTTNTRPDMSAKVGIAAQKVSNPSVTNFQNLQQIALEMIDTANLHLKLGGDADLKLVAYVDAAWGGENSEDVGSRSRHGAILTLGNGCISWWSRVQSTVALSSAESEFLAVSEVVRDIKYIRSLLEELLIKQSGPTDIMEDNEACITMINDGIISRKTRHIAIKERFAIQAARDENIIRMKKIPTKDNIADVMTKLLGRVKLKDIRQYLNMVML